MHFLDQAKIFIRSGAGGPGEYRSGGKVHRVRRARRRRRRQGRRHRVRGGARAQYFDRLSLYSALPGAARQGRGRIEQDRRGGEDLVIKVPIGTQILADDENRTLLADLTVDGQRIVFLRGGLGGRGNASYKTSTNRAPRQHQTGEAGEEMWIWLRLKLLADVGLVGLPNAGKSTFLNSVTNASAKVGDYPFTTLRPQLGVVRHKGREFVLADIPGLIEGAAEGEESATASSAMSNARDCSSTLLMVRQKTRSAPGKSFATSSRNMMPASPESPRSSASPRPT